MTFYFLISGALVALLILESVFLVRFWRERGNFFNPSTPRFKQNLVLTKKQLFREIERHQETEIRLQEAQTYLQCLIDSMPFILVGVSPDGAVSHWNKSAEKVTGFTLNEAFGQTVLEVFPTLPISMEMINKTISTGQAQYYKNLQKGKGSNATFTDLTLYPLRISENIEEAVVIADDVTQRVRMDSKIIQNDKMLSLGEMAAGMAHELNNPLAGILHNVGSIYRRIEALNDTNIQSAKALGIDLEHIQMYLQERKIFTFLENIRIGGERAAHIVSNMLNFARTSSVTLVETDLRELVERALEFAQNTPGFNTGSCTRPPTIHKDFQHQLPKICCSQIEIQQVIVNLVNNATQALASKEGDYAPRDPEIHLHIHSNEEYVTLKVSDNGPGMNEEVRQHIFEPFYTTKDAGKGTGLGLAVCYFIIAEHHKGTIDVETKPGEGSTFTISLPISHTDRPNIPEA